MSTLTTLHALVRVNVKVVTDGAARYPPYTLQNALKTAVNKN